MGSWRRFSSPRRVSVFGGPFIKFKGALVLRYVGSYSGKRVSSSASLTHMFVRVAALLAQLPT